MRDFLTGISILLLSLSSYGQDDSKGDLIVRFATPQVDTFARAGKWLLSGPNQSTWFDGVLVYRSDTILDLDTGLYSIEYYLSNQRVTTYDQIRVVADSTTSFSVFYRLPQIIEQETEDRVKLELGFEGLLGADIDQTSLELGLVGELGFKEGIYVYFTPRLAWGYIFSLSISDASFKYDSLKYTSPQYKSERYKSFYWTNGLVLRATANRHTIKDYGPTIDLGFQYRTPISFRHVILFQDHGRIYGNLHRYNDFRPFVQIGYRPFLLFANYRLFDTIGSDLLPQEPRVMIGLTLLLSEHFQ